MRVSHLLSVLALLPAGALAGPVDVNSADADSLARELTGIGPAKAEAIVAFREANGEFQVPEDLLRVQGIGPSTLESIRDDLRFSEETAAASGGPGD
ncbi:MAG: helix-hairpin-helix domain-containing protein [Gammaproteobacteria bacterium]